MLPKTLPALVKILTQTFPRAQAEREARWIANELAEANWIAACNKRAQHYPLQYILHTQPFGDLELLCKPNVLIPRLDTEDWVLEAIETLKNDNVKLDRILDYCTGSGCIGLSFASQFASDTVIDCVDYSEDAVNLALENLTKNDSHIISECNIHQGNLFEGYIPHDDEYRTPNTANLLVSNPPYIPDCDLVEGEVELSVLKYEPRDALLGDVEFYDALCDNIIQKYPSFKGFICELGYMEQAKRMAEKLPTKDWVVGIRNDHSGHIRNVLGWKRNSELGVLNTMVHSYLQN